MRNMIWSLVRSNLPEFQRLPWWALAVRAILYPLDFFYWRMGETRGYQWESDTWIIEGVRYSACSMRHLARADGEIYRVTRIGDNLKLERLNSQP